MRQLGLTERPFFFQIKYGSWLQSEYSLLQGSLTSNIYYVTWDSDLSRNLKVVDRFFNVHVS